MIETRIALACPLRRPLIDLLQIAEHGFHRRVHAIEIQAVKPDLCGTGGTSIVVCSQPLDELDHLFVAPHPGRETPEVGERFHGIDRVARATDVAIDGVSVGPVGFHRHAGETFFVNEPLRDLGTLAVELVRAVRRLAEQREARLADPIHQRIVVAGSAGQRMSRAQCLEERAVGRGWRPLLPWRVSPRQKSANFLIARLREILVPATDGVERLGRGGTDDIVRFDPHLFATLR
jgi:hypothetical protein